MMTKIEMQAMDAVIGIHREMKKANEINWEQRRYEIAKEAGICYLGNTQAGKFSTAYQKQCAIEAVEFADVLIAELKREKE